MRLFVGQAAPTQGFERYRERFNLLELLARPSGLPKMQRLKEWRRTAPPAFAFSVVLPESVGRLDSSEASASELDQALEARAALDARFLLLRTAASVTPSARARAGIEKLCATLKQSGARVAWEPRGLWEFEQATDFADALGLDLVGDLSRGEIPDASVVYTRLRALGTGGRVSAGLLEDVAEQLADKDEVYVVIEGSGAAKAQALLRQFLVDASGD